MLGSPAAQEMGSEVGAPPPGPTAGVSVDTDTADTSCDAGDNTGTGQCVHTEADFKFNFVIDQ